MSEGALSGHRILVIEDDYFLADECNRKLRAAGAAVLGPVPSVEAALELLGSNDAPDLVLLDVNLGGQMAYPVADALVAKKIPFLFMTGYDQSSLPERFAAIHRVEKPFEAQAILGELRKPAFQGLCAP
jgi:DNA-binding response OmpR family regulator